MSIIYEALQKTQQHRKKSSNVDFATPTKKPRRRFIWTLTTLTVIVCMSVFISVCYSKFIKHRTKKISVAVARPLVTPPPVIQQPILKPKPNVQLILNGVFISDQEQFAEINKQYYHLGEIVNGMKIVGIDFNTVKLQDTNQQLLLQAAS